MWIMPNGGYCYYCYYYLLLLLLLLFLSCMGLLRMRVAFKIFSIKLHEIQVPVEKYFKNISKYVGEIPGRPGQSNIKVIERKALESGRLGFKFNTETRVESALKGIVFVLLLCRAYVAF